VTEYEETFTTVLMASGLTKMSARVPTCLFTTDAGSLTAPQLAQRLQVSPASISKAIAFLESQSLVRREHDEQAREVLHTKTEAENADGQPSGSSQP
jgi:DNA-binding MarR family transcriptional regulator